MGRDGSAFLSSGELSNPGTGGQHARRPQEHNRDRRGHSRSALRLLPDAGQQRRARDDVALEHDVLVHD